MQRRDFVRNLALGAVALAVTPAGRMLAKASIPAVGREGWSGAAFEHLRGTSFRVNGPDGVQVLTLDDVEHRRSRGVESASLRFRGDAGRQLAHGSYEFQHRDLGRMGILIVPGTASGGTCTYRAIFNRFV